MRNALKGRFGHPNLPKRLILSAAAVFALVLFVTLVPAPKRIDLSLTLVEEAGVLRVALDASYPPFEMEQDGAFSGFDVDLARQIAGSMGVKVEFVNMGFDSLYDALLTRRADAVISAFQYAPEMTRDMAFSASYLTGGQVTVVARGNTAIRDPSDLNGKRVAVERGSAAESAAKKLLGKGSDVRLQGFPTGQEALDAVAAGQVDVTIADFVEAGRQTPGPGALRDSRSGA
ncbi:MAG: amino acid ABC transporter substrate-binding protein [Chloroflexi bacterium]|nr:amino acid ABC transporter substrate-binding protein [Chloroflexota bacterium]